VHRRPYLLLFALVAWVALPASPAMAAAPAASGPFSPTLATKAQLAAAQESNSRQSGLSAEYPDICHDATEPVRTREEHSGIEGRVDLSPPLLEFASLTPGTSYRNCFTVHNLGTTAVHFDVFAVDIVGSRKADEQKELVSPPVGVGLYLHPAIRSFDLAPDESMLVPYLLDVPRNPPKGVSVGGLNVRQSPPSAEATGATITLAILHQVSITFPGGEAKPLAVAHVQAPWLLMRTKGEHVYRAKLDVTNVGTLLEVFDAKLTVHGLGRSVGSDSSGTGVLLPDGRRAIELDADDVPWIGIYRPHIRVSGRGGDVEVGLPWLLVLPPWPYVIALLIAILLPIFSLLRRWRQRRAEWHAYLAEEIEAEDDWAEWHDD
jgi:hypothetical protein